MRWIVLLLAGCGRVNFGYPIEPCEDVNAAASTLANGTCYTRHDTPISRLDAHSACLSLGGHILTITSAEENDDVAALPRDQSMWMGLYNGAGTAWRWIPTNEQLVYSNWAAGQPAMCPAGSGSGGLYQVDGTWTTDCETSGHPFMCEIAPWYVDEATNHGYRIIWLDDDWFGVDAACKSAGGHLATITSAAERDFLGGLVYDYLWLGATSADGVTFSWVTGEPFGDFTAWAIGPQMGGCVLVSGNQQWEVTDCSAPQMGLCEREPP